MANNALRRLRLARQWTQAELAERVCAQVRAATGKDAAVDAVTISKLERGLITWPNRDYRQALRAVFEVHDDAALGFYAKRTKRDSEEVSDTDRRDFLGLAGLVLADPIPNRLGKSDVAALADRTYALEEWDRRTGGRSTHHLATAELRHAVRLTQASTTPNIRAQLCCAIGNLADLSGWTTFDAGMNRPARRIFALGIEAAKESGDHGMVCHVASGLARMEIQANRPAEALALADQAMGDVPVSALAMLAVIKAQAYALRGDSSQVLRQVSLAESIYERIGDLRDDPRWIWYFTFNKLQGDIGDALFALSRTAGRPPGGLVGHLRRAVDSHTSDRARTKAISAARLATVLHDQGARDEAQHYATLATDLAVIVQSARLDTAITEMRMVQQA